jgi:predicted metalloprotease with PDZ domain
LKKLSQAISEFENRPAHLTQSVEQSSLDAWLEKYPRYDRPERSISYYNKGDLLGVLLDLAMRNASHGSASLRELFRTMNADYAKHSKFFADSEAVEHESESLSHTDLHSFFEKYVSGTDEIPWDSFFAAVGLRVIKTDVTFADPEFEATRIFDQPLTVQAVGQESEAQRAGLKPDDVILEINGEAPQRDFATQIAALGPSATLQLTVSRNGAQHRLHWKLASRTLSVFRLQDVPGVTAQQKSERAAWLFDRGENSAVSANPPTSKQ